MALQIMGLRHGAEMTGVNIDYHQIFCYSKDVCNNMSHKFIVLN